MKLPRTRRRAGEVHLGVHEPYKTIHHLAEVAGHAVSAGFAGFVKWVVTASVDGVLGPA